MNQWYTKFKKHMESYKICGGTDRTGLTSLFMSNQLDKYETKISNLRKKLKEATKIIDLIDDIRHLEKHNTSLNEIYEEVDKYLGRC